jgi:hypothetical protein
MVIFSLLRKKEMRPVAYRISVEPAINNRSKINLSQVLLLKLAIAELLQKH